MASWETARQRCGGNGSPQMPVKPEFNMEEANRMLSDYKGGHSNFPVAQGIVDSFVMDYKASHEGEQYSEQETDIDKDSDYSGLNWASDLGIITGKDRAVFERTINNEIFRGAEPQSANGEYIIDTGKCLMFTDGDFHRPTLSRVIVFVTEYESLLDEAKRRILYEAGSTGEVQVSQRIIENLYGPGFAVEYTPEIHGAYAGQNGRGKRANGKGSGRGYHAKSLKERFAEEGLSHLLEDNDEVYSEHEDEGFKDYDIESAVYAIRHEKAQRRQDLVSIGNMPTLYRGLFNLDGEVYVSNEHLYQNMVSRDTAIAEGRFNQDASADYHELGETKVINAIEQFQNPLAIMESLKDFKEPRLVAILEEKGNDKENLIAVLELYSKARAYGSTKERSHVLITIYEKNSLPDYIEKTVDKGRILHIKNGASSDTFARLQLSGDISKETLKKNVAQFNKKVKAFKEKNKIYYSEHDTDYSNRSLLANAFEGITKDSEEYALVQEYKGRIKLLNEQEEKLAKLNAEIRKLRFGTPGPRDTAKLSQLEADAKKAAQAINRHDKKLLSMEASEPLRKVIERERKKEARKTKEHVKEIQQNKKLRAEQTELRHKIRKAVRDLDKILKHGDKKRHVKEDMKGFASKALELADYLFTDHISNDELIRKGITVRMTPEEAALVKETEEIVSQLYDNVGSLTAEEYERLDAKRKRNMTENERIEFDKKVTEANGKLVESVASFFGIPVKNVRREIIGVIDHAGIASANAGKTTAQSTWDTICDAMIDSLPLTWQQKDALYLAHGCSENTIWDVPW